MLGEMVTDFGAKRAEYARRSKAYEEISVPRVQWVSKETEGWYVQRETKNGLRLRRGRPIEEITENRFWNILYRFGYDQLNKGRRFPIQIGKGQSTVDKHVDIFAKDDETIVIARCWSQRLPTKLSLLDDLNDFAELMKPMADAVRLHYGQDYKPKIIWCIVTENIRWSESDLRRAKEYNIKVIQGLELIYFEEFSKKLGPAARYQFHAEYLEDQKVPAFSGRKVPAVKTKLGGKTAYLFSALAKDILRIGFVNHRDLRDPSGAPSYQRIVKPSRLKEIGRFLDGGKFFPNTILLNFHRKPLFEPLAKDEISSVHFGNLVLPDRYKSCWIIDGQHRLYGTTYTQDNYDTPLFFIGFDSVSTSEEANIFVEINSKQATVPPTLLSALEGEVKWDSDDPKERLSAIASRAVDLLNTRGGGALEGKVVSPGITAGTSQPLNVRSIQDRIIQSGLVGVLNPRTGEIAPGPCWSETSEGALRRLVTLLEVHFEEVQAANPERWEKVVQKLRSRSMPPAQSPRPDDATYDGLATWLEAGLDRVAVARPNPARPLLHRMNRAEYRNAIRDLLALDVDVSTLPADDATYGFDNIADALGTSPLLLESYVTMARKISRTAIGSTAIPAVTLTYQTPEDLTQDYHLRDLPLGTRGGLRVEEYFAADAEYEIRVRLRRTATGAIRGISDEHQLELTLDGQRIGLFPVGGKDAYRAVVANDQNPAQTDDGERPPEAADTRQVVEEDFQHRQHDQRCGRQPCLLGASPQAIAEEGETEAQPRHRVGPDFRGTCALPNCQQLALERVAHLQCHVAEQKHQGQHGGAGYVPVGTHAAGSARKNDRGERRKQVGEQQRAEDNRPADGLMAEQRILDHAEAKQRDKPRDDTEDHRRSPKHRIGTC